MSRRTTNLLGALLLSSLGCGGGLRGCSTPRQMRSTGSPGAYASVIRHTGRSTREPYETPVGAVATEDGFVIALVDGRGTDWLENLLASGSDECLRVRRVEREAAAAQRPGPR